QGIEALSEERVVRDNLQIRIRRGDPERRESLVCSPQRLAVLVEIHHAGDQAIGLLSREFVEKLIARMFRQGAHRIEAFVRDIDMAEDEAALVTRSDGLERM